MIASDPALKPTTAIKALGFDDPSVIRRLRDKYKAWADARDLRPSELPARSEPLRTPAVARTEAVGPALLRTSEPVRRAPLRPPPERRSAPDRRPVSTRRTPAALKPSTAPAARSRPAPRPPRDITRPHQPDPDTPDHPAAASSQPAAQDPNPFMTMMMLTAGAVALASCQQLALYQAVTRHPLATAAVRQQLWMARFIAASTALAVAPREHT